jgi:hypothetical protein
VRDAQEKIAALGRGQWGLAVVATTGDEVLVVIAVVAVQAFGHPVRVVGRFELDCDPALSPIVTNPLIRTKRE